MKVTQTGTVYQLTFFPTLFPVNCYLVDEGDSLTLIDTALPFSYRAIVRYAAERHKPIARIVLTHAHSDHIGSLDRLKTMLPDSEVIISERDARLLAGDRSLDDSEPQTPIKGGVPKPGQITTTPDTLVSEGDQIGSFHVVAAPGHTPGHIALFNEKSGVLIAGDAFQMRGGIAVSGDLRPTFPFPALATWNKEAAVKSAMRLRSLSPRLLAVGHGKLLEQPDQALAQSIRRAQKNFEKRMSLE